LERHRHYGDGERGCVAADDVDFQSLLLRRGHQRQETNDQGGKKGHQAAQQSIHRQIQSGM
jgi:hypothetical protein